MDYSLNITNIISALIIVILGVILARIASNFIRKIIEEIELDKLIKKTGFVIPFGKHFYLGIRYLIYFGTLVLALRELGISNKGLEALFIITFALIIVFIILAFKDIFPSLIARFVFLGKYDLKKGDEIEFDDIKGKIKNIGLLETEIKTKKESIFIPNSVLVKKIIKKK